MKNITPQEVYELYRDAIYRQKQEGTLPDGWLLPPATWEEVSEQGKALYAQMALKMKGHEDKEAHS